jgi:hypothetical protein
MEDSLCGEGAHLDNPSIPQRDNIANIYSGFNRADTVEDNLVAIQQASGSSASTTESLAQALPQSWWDLSRHIGYLLTMVHVAGDLDISTPSKQTLDETTTSLIPSTDREFIIFAKLPAELRLKIWKHALPGPRVVQYCTRKAWFRTQDKVEKCCAAVNSMIKITYACHESFQVVQSCYEKLVVTLDPSTVSADEKYRFIHVNYNIDAVYLEFNWLYLADRIKLFPHLSKVKHLATAECNMREPELTEEAFWDILRVSCPALKQVSFVFISCQEAHEFGGDWALVPFPSTPHHNIDLPDPSVGYGPEREEVVAEFGSLKVIVAESQELRKDIDSYTEKYEWSSLSFDVGLVAKRKSGRAYWKLHYFHEILNDNGYSWYNHYHREPIKLGTGTLLSCDAIYEELSEDDLCSRCGEHRWTTCGDPFWLLEGEDQDSDGSTSSLGTCEDFREDRPVEDTGNFAEESDEDAAN